MQGASEPASAEASPGAGPSPRILVADASAAARSSLVATVSRIAPRARVVEAATGREVAEALRAGAGEIAFIDLEMPAMNAAETLGIARRDGVRPFVVLMSHEINAASEAFARDIEAYEFLVKPVEPHEVGRILSNHARMTKASRVLVADHSKSFRHLIRKVLSATRFAITVDVVDNGEVAIGMLKQHPYNVFFLDYEMPGLDGLETACLVAEVSPSTRVIMISVDPTDAVEKAARYFGAIAFLRKPFYPPQVDRALHLAFDLPLPSLLANSGGARPQDGGFVATGF
jgi:CheY-like chemotaxis protein